MEFVEKLGKWVPLLIAAGYFVFLVATYVRMTSEMRTAMAAANVSTEVKKDE